MTSKLPNSMGIRSMLNEWLRKFKLQSLDLVSTPTNFSLVNSIACLVSKTVEVISPRRLKAMDMKLLSARLVPSCFFEHEHVVINPTSAGMGYHHHRITYRIFLTGFRSCTSCSHYQSISKQTTRNSNSCRDVAVLSARGTTFGTSFELDGSLLWS
ncbi:hypothetical protein Tco_0091689 [Tanacetum coccineum]